MRFPMFTATAALLISVATPNSAQAQVAEGKDFNSYVLRAVDDLNKNYAAKGYANSAYTHVIKYGPDSRTQIRPGKPPYTMCVAAVGEVIATALNFYMEDHKNDPEAVKKVLQYLPPEGWMRMRLKDIRSHIWVDSHLKAYGTADAMSTFGIGRHAHFRELKPGSFVNLNRLNKSGHAVTFLGFINREGDPVATYGPTVAGFKYFSSQGKAYSPGSGFGYRYAFFNVAGQKYCPALRGGKRVDCGIIFKDDQNMLNTGYMLLPDYWDAAYRDQSLKEIGERIYHQNYNRGRGEYKFGANLTTTQFIEKLNQKDTMKMGSKYLDQTMPEDVRHSGAK